MCFIIPLTVEYTAEEIVKHAYNTTCSLLFNCCVQGYHGENKVVNPYSN